MEVYLMTGIYPPLDLKKEKQNNTETTLPDLHINLINKSFRISLMVI